jgi:glycosyltransferase involved in cell wall biosynthesis
MDRLKILFWQNINSMHQSAFLKALALRHDVTLITIRQGSGREDMGWYEPALPGVTLLDIRAIDWKSLIRQHTGNNSVHVFAGLHAFAPVHRAFLFALSQRCRIGVYAEPLVMKGALGIIKQWRGRLDYLRYADRIDFILCIGKKCKLQYQGWGFPTHKLFDWAYVTEPMDSPIPMLSNDRPFRIIFPASCSLRKGADLLLEAAASMKVDMPFELICYTMSSNVNDRFEQQMQARYGAIDNIRLLPFIENHQVKIAIGESDLMVLPSRFDGWGAVVNEALGAGTPVLVSDQCGSSALLSDHKFMGEVFAPPEVSALRDALVRAIGEGIPTLKRRQLIRAWSERYISGESLTRHFISILSVTQVKSREPILAPWEPSSLLVEASSQLVSA